MKKPLYIVITPFFPTLESFRGPFIFDQVKSIEQTGRFKVSVWRPKPWYKKIKSYTFDNITVNYFNVFELPSDIMPGLFNHLTITSFLHRIKKSGIKISDIKIMHCHVTKTGFIANYLKRKYPKIKTILQHHGFDVLNLTNGYFSSFAWHQRWVRDYGINICNAIDMHIGVSAKTLMHLKNISNIKIKESYILYNGVDVKKFFPIQGLKNINYFTIGCIGNFWTIKDQITLIKAAEKLILNGYDNIRVLLIGSGELLETCKLYVNKHHIEINIVFLYEIPHNELCYFYNTLDLFVLPSYYEALGCVYIEADACGVPFIAVKDQGIEELILEENRQYQLIAPQSINDLIEKIKYFIDNRYFKPRIKKNMEIDILITEYLNLFST